MLFPITSTIGTKLKLSAFVYHSFGTEAFILIGDWTTSTNQPSLVKDTLVLLPPGAFKRFCTQG